jgi:hypothetical protein
MEGSQTYRDEAARVRLGADLVNDSDDRGQLLDIADQYDHGDQPQKWPFGRIVCRITLFVSSIRRATQSSHQKLFLPMMTRRQ